MYRINFSLKHNLILIIIIKAMIWRVTMKILRKIFILIMVPVMITTLLIGSIQKNDSISSNVVPGQIVKVGVILSTFDNVYISLVTQSLEKIQKENSGKVEFTFLDGKGDQVIQNQLIDTTLQKDFDLFLVNLVDTSTVTASSVINKVKQTNVPLILFNIAPFLTESIKSYNKALIIATDVEQSGVLEGKLLVDEWNTNKLTLDKNKDNILQYVMLSGNITDTLSIARTKYSVSTINNAGIKTQELALLVTTGTQESAKNAIESLFSNQGDKIEAIIANNDTMAIGAIQALQQYGYNTGDKALTISVVGINGIPEAEDLIKKGFMTGTVVQDAPAMAEALYTVGMNLVYGKSALQGTDYKFDETGVIIKMPYHPYIEK